MDAMDNVDGVVHSIFQGCGRDWSVQAGLSGGPLSNGMERHCLVWFVRVQERCSWFGGFPGLSGVLFILLLDNQFCCISGVFAVHGEH
jgi:hypothetical protein